MLYSIRGRGCERLRTIYYALRYTIEVTKFGSIASGHIRYVFGLSNDRYAWAKVYCFAVSFSSWRLRNRYLRIPTPGVFVNPHRGQNKYYRTDYKRSFPPVLLISDYTTLQSRVITIYMIIIICKNHKVVYLFYRPLRPRNDNNGSWTPWAFYSKILQSKNNDKMSAILTPDCFF